MKSNLQPGAVTNYLVPITEPEFFEYVMVRISSIVLNVTGRIDLLLFFKKTINIYLKVLFPQVSYQGDDFYDRDLARKVVAFCSNPRTYNYIFF